MIRIAIAEDNAFLAKSLVDGLGTDSSIRVKHVARDGKELLDMLEQDAQIDIILMDIEMPIMSGIEAAQKVNKKYPQIKIMMLTIFEDEGNLFQSIQAGAHGYLLKDEPLSKLLESIREVVGGGASMSGIMAMKTLRILKHQPLKIDDAEEYDLSKRETEQLCEGLTYVEIAENLIISPKTVRKHIENVYRKLNVHSKVEAINMAQKNRLI